jgi:hypothetical protein
MEADQLSETETHSNASGHRLENEKTAGEANRVAAGKIDREKVTPMFMKMYCRIGGHHRYKCASIDFVKMCLMYLFVDLMSLQPVASQPMMS